MLSYQHAFHAGNHADVLKHIVLIAMLEKLNKKPKPYFVLDTHAGTGLYDLSKAPPKADATAFDTLFANTASLNVLPAALKAYVTFTQSLQTKHLYPGSPYLLSHFSREQDTVHVNELAASMFAELEHAAQVFQVGGQKVHLHQRDGFELLNALTPPMPKRGMVLIDPPYEQAKEYDDVSQAIFAALKKWPKGSYMIWYPLLSPTRINRKTGKVEANPKAPQSSAMLARLCDITKQLCTGGMLVAEFAVASPSEKIGMYGSGVCIINPPYQIDDELQQVLSVLTRHLQHDTNELSQLRWLIPSL